MSPCQTMSIDQNRRSNILIVGAGASGLACAWALARQNLTVTLIDSGPPGRGAIWASGGMLAAGFECAVELDGRHDQAQAFSDMCHASAKAWSDWVGQIEAVSGQLIHYQNNGVVLPCFDKAERERLDQVEAQADALGIKTQPVKSGELADLEPGLAPGLAALKFPNDGQLDNRALSTALIHALKAKGVNFVQDEVCALETEAGQLSGVRLEDERLIKADAVVLATGASPLAKTLVSLDVRPVRGQMLALDIEGVMPLGHVVRAFSIYLAQKPDRLVIGATSEPDQADLSTDAAKTQALLQAAIDVVPALSGQAILEDWAGLRPYAPNAMPVLGELKPGVFAALGGYRNGVLLAPAFGEAIASLITGRTVPGYARAFLAGANAPALV